MTERTILAIGGRRLTVARPVKRALQIALSLVVTAFVALVAIGIASVYAPRGGLRVGFLQWLALIQRPDIQGTALITAIVSVLVIYWQRDREQR